MRFVLTADVAYSGTLNVNVEVTEDGSFLTGTIPSVITIASGTRTSDLILETDDDGTEEDHGWVHAKIKSGSNYLLGDPTTSSMRVWDNDTPVTPALSIAPFYSPVTEGNNVIFTVTADRAPASLLYFNVGATEIGNYLSYPIATEITMDAGSTVTYYILATIDDDVIEPDGFVTGYIQNGTGYTVGSPSSATVPVTSEDRPDPPTPSNFRVTTATSNSISLAWNSLTGASAYQIQYRLARRRQLDRAQQVQCGEPYPDGPDTQTGPMSSKSEPSATQSLTQPARATGPGRPSGARRPRSPSRIWACDCVWETQIPSGSRPGH